MGANDPIKLIFIKLFHTLIWVFFNVVIFYLLYAVVLGEIDKWVWICLSLILLEGLVLLIFKTFCPITLIARKYSQSEKSNFDIYLPEWLAKYNKTIYTAIVAVAVIILIYRLINT
ncbi:MAG: hypothetical protein K0M56_04100 [Kaistella sp.]|nr:hypothetical protein [Kaistella sp.]